VPRRERAQASRRLLGGAWRLELELRHGRDEGGSLHKLVHVDRAVAVRIEQLEHAPRAVRAARQLRLLLQDLELRLLLGDRGVEDGRLGAKLVER